MNPEHPQPDVATLDAELRALVEAGHVPEATERVLRAWGPRLLSYQYGLLGDEALAQDAFQLFSLRLWQGLERFAWRSSVLTWAYRVARNAALRTATEPFRKRANRLATDEAENLRAEWTRESTAAWQRTREKSKLWQAIESLPRDERELLLLRLVEQLSWQAIADVVAEGELDADERKRAAATARKRFERVKAKLREGWQVEPEG